ncbi:hypothetical protein QAD02_019615 [Eretmocerus hayati]|uniref:Uncharacterized protein n=1 Tax=Eretmocerus hayati TaxID=131215 RepID=A0ACC2PL59_9HYME|nr:hypothetical protein QAD02_019615 [Eretmocerus hayati]
MVVIRHPDDIEILFSSQSAITKGFFYDFLHPWLQSGLLTSTGSLWHQRRKLLTPAFHFSILKKYMEITSDEVTKTIRFLNAEGKESIQSLIPFSSEYTLNVVCESAMGVSLRSMNQESVEEYKKAIHDQGNIVLYRMPRPYLTDWILPLVYKVGNLQKKVLKILHGFTAEVIRGRRDYHERTNFKYLEGLVEDNDDKEYDIGLEIFDITAISFAGRKKRLCMLDLLLEAERDGMIDSKGIQEEVDTFTFEGHDTTGMALAFTLLLLAENQNEQELARREAIEVLDKNNGSLNLTILQELKYIERCIKESLRLYPPVATMMRQTSTDLKLKNALVPANTHVMIRLFDTHRDPNFWPEPDKFNPDRFLPESMKDRHPFAYVPFSAGPRNCIGTTVNFIHDFDMKIR